MKKTMFIAILLCALQGTAQIRLVGIGTSASMIDILQWDALDSSTVNTTPSLLWGCLLGSSAFDAYSSQYYLTGYSSDTSGLYSFNTETGTQSMTGYTNFSNITEFDMSTGKIYDLQMSGGYLVINEYDISTGQDSLIGTVNEPGIQGIVVDATGFDSNNGILYYIGFDGTNEVCLFGLHVREIPFTYTKIPIVTSAQNSNIYGLNFDNVTSQLFANEAVFDSTFNYISNRIVEVSVATGVVIPRGDLTGFYGFVVGSSCFDQYTGSYMIVGVDTTNINKMIVFNTSDNTYVTGYVPWNASEIVCDNHSFSTAFYATSAGDKVADDGLRVYPNPAVGKLYVTNERGFGLGKLTLTNLSGNVILQRDFYPGNSQSIDVSGLPRGCYLLQHGDVKGEQVRMVILR